MPVKKAHIYNAAYRVLADLCGEKGAYASAGEFALHMGICRTTAVKWLKEMLSEKAIVSIKVQAKNGVMGTFYATPENLIGNETIVEYERGA